MKFTKKFKENAALVVLGVVLFWGLTNYDKFFRLLGVMIGVLKPVIFGCIIAFILNVPMSGIEKRLFKKPKKREICQNCGNAEKTMLDSADLSALPRRCGTCVLAYYPCTHKDFLSAFRRYPCAYFKYFQQAQQFP